MFFAIIILVIGIILILQALGIISSFSWTFFWGILLFILGLKMLSKKKHYCIHCEWFGHKDHSHENHN